jgi:GPH family glycoside/pentoside/hexuronide:cation symporter
MITIKERIGYGLGDMSSSMFWKIFGMYLMIFYTDVFGIPAAVVGTMFLVTRFFDAANDPIMGIIADRTNSRHGKYRPYLLWFALPFALIGILTFYTPSVNINQKIIYAYITYIMMMIVYTIVNVPYASLLGVMSPNPKERNVLSTYRMGFAYLGSFITVLLFMPIVNQFINLGVTEQHAWTYAVAIIGLICALLFWSCFKLTKERVKPISSKKTPL